MNVEILGNFSNTDQSGLPFLQVPRLAKISHTVASKKLALGGWFNENFFGYLKLPWFQSSSSHTLWKPCIQLRGPDFLDRSNLFHWVPGTNCLWQILAAYVSVPKHQVRTHKSTLRPILHGSFGMNFSWKNLGSTVYFPECHWNCRSFVETECHSVGAKSRARVTKLGFRSKRLKIHEPWHPSREGVLGMVLGGFKYRTSGGVLDV